MFLKNNPFGASCNHVLNSCSLIFEFLYKVFCLKVLLYVGLNTFFNLISYRLLTRGFRRPTSDHNVEGEDNISIQEHQ